MSCDDVLRVNVIFYLKIIIRAQNYNILYYYTAVDCLAGGAFVFECFATIYDDVVHGYNIIMIVWFVDIDRWFI